MLHRSPTGTTGGTTLTSSGTFADGAWHQVTAVKTGTNLSLFVDGALENSGTVSGTFASALQVVMGNSGLAGTQFFSGDLDDVRLYSEALDATGIADLAAGDDVPGGTQAGDLEAYWPFDCGVRTADSLPDDDSVRETTLVDTFVDLSITKVGTPDPTGIGGTLSYTLTVTNNGPSNSSGSTVTDTLPADLAFAASPDCTEASGTLTCVVDPLLSGNSQVLTYTATVLPTAASPIVNTATVTGLESDPVPANNSATESITLDLNIPFVPEVVTDEGEIDECDDLKDETTQIRVSFSEDMNDPAGDTGASDVSNPNNYRLIAAGADLDLDTVTCGAAAGDDVLISIDAVIYKTGTQTATLDINGGMPLGDEPYRLLVCDTIEDTQGNTLAGVFVRTFRLDMANVFFNGHWDCDTRDWTLDAPGTSEAEHVDLDIDDASISGSLRTRPTIADSVSFAQCVERITGGSSLPIGTSLRVDASTGRSVDVDSFCEFYDAVTCGGTNLGLDQATENVPQTSGGWVSISRSIPVPATALSAICGFTVSMTDAGVEDIDVYFDDGLGLGTAIFSDGFETGDTSQWSSTMP